MRWPLSRSFYSFLFCCVLLTSTVPGLVQATTPIQKSITAQKKGFRFPSFRVTYFQYAEKRRYYRRLFHFSSVVGKVPVLLYYFLPDHAPSETELKAFAAASKLFEGKVKFFGVTKAQNQKEAKKAYARIKALKIELPVLLDQRGLLAYVMLTRRVPSYAMITRSGYLRLANASTLSESVAPGVSLLNLVKRVSKGEEIPYTRALGYSPNPYDLIGKPAPKIEATHVLKRGKVTLKRWLSKRRPVLLVFWSVTCPHCRGTIPHLERYINDKKQVFEVLTVVQAYKKKLRKTLRRFVRKHRLKMTIVTQKTPKAMKAYRIMQVPTLFMLDAKGVVRAVRLGGGKKVGKLVDQMLKSLKK